jgi:2-amino-4-hydroxy-6-hydroxymethyldihydropteridine diphosphokinase
MTRVYVGLGSNLANREANLVTGVEGVEALPDTVVTGVSSIYETAPVGDPGHPAYLNAVLRAETTLDPRTLLEGLLAVERAAGRDGRQRNAPRTLDLDLLLHGDARIDEPGLAVPHPRLAFRGFVLVPLVELEPGLVHPALGETMERLLDRAGTGPGVRLHGPFPVQVP